MKGMLDGLFTFLKSEKHIKKTYPSHGFIFHDWKRVSAMGFSILESLKSAERRFHRVPFS